MLTRLENSAKKRRYMYYITKQIPRELQLSGDSFFP